MTDSLVCPILSIDISAGHHRHLTSTLSIMSKKNVCLSNPLPLTENDVIQNGSISIGYPQTAVSSPRCPKIISV